MEINTIKQKQMKQKNYKQMPMVLNENRPVHLAPRISVKTLLMARCETASGFQSCFCAMAQKNFFTA